jgi:hypothetical protein
VVLSPFIFVGLCLLFLVFEHFRGMVSLARYRRAQAAEGRVLTPADLVSDLPKGENGAPEVMAAARALVKGTVLPDYYPPRMRITPSGRAVIGSNEDEWMGEHVTNRWDDLVADVHVNQAALDQICIALQEPVLDNQLDYAQGPKMRLQHLSKIKAIAQWLGPASMVELREGSMSRTADYLVAEIKLPQALIHDRVIISELVRHAIASIARSDTWEVLQADGWSDEDLTRIQKAWEEVSFIGPAKRSFEGESVFVSGAFELYRRSNQEAVDVMDYFGYASSSKPGERSSLMRTVDNLPGVETIRDFVKEQIRCRIWRFAWLDQSERRHLERIHKLIEISRRAQQFKSMSEARPALEEFENAGIHPGFYDRLRFPTEFMTMDTLARVVNRAMRMETERSVVLAAIGIKRYTLRHGRAPESLSALVPEFLPAVPVDYMDGKPLRYRLNPDGSTVLYSVGEDTTDGGGDAGVKADAGNARNIWDRKDFVWPAPALPEEVEAYRVKALRSD